MGTTRKSSTGVHKLGTYSTLLGFVLGASLGMEYKEDSSRGAARGTAKCVKQ